MWLGDVKVVGNPISIQAISFPCFFFDANLTVPGRVWKLGPNLRLELRTEPGLNRKFENRTGQWSPFHNGYGLRFS